jgi:hypothetical protein
MDERVVESVIRAVLRRKSFVVRFGDVEDELRRLVTSEDEFKKLRHELFGKINPISARGNYDTCYIYRIYEDSLRDNDVIVVVPFCLDDESEKPTLEELGKLYREKDEKLHKALDSVINELIKVWARDMDIPVDVDDAVSLLRKKLSSGDPSQDKVIHGYGYDVEGDVLTVYESFKQGYGYTMYRKCNVVHGDADVEEYKWSKKIKPKSIPVVVKCTEGSIDDMFVSKTVDIFVYTQYGWKAVRAYDGVKEIKETGGSDE